MMGGDHDYHEHTRRASMQGRDMLADCPCRECKAKRELRAKASERGYQAEAANK